MEPGDLDDEVLVAARHHGANVARVTAQLAGKQLFARGVQAPAGEVLEKFRALMSEARPGAA